MNIVEVLKLADELLFTHTGEHLDSLQETIIQGTLQGHKYAKIASEKNLSEGHVRDTASQLWQKLSNVLGEDINKLNARNILEKLIISNRVSSGKFISFHQISICSKQNQLPKSSSLSQTIEKNHLDIDTAPEITAFYGRNDELKTLKNWLIQDCPRIITLTGLIGIGKTTLAIKLIEEIQTEFEHITYRSLRYCPSINIFLIDLLQSFVSTPLPNTLDRKVNLLQKILRKHRCLIIIDDVQMIFENGQLSGQYKAEFEEYYLLFNQIAELSHASSLLLITNEQPEDSITNRHKFTRSLKLTGLGESAKQILKDKQLSDKQMWDILIEKYQSHPLWLEMTATMIQELFAGNLTEFLSYPSSILSNEIVAQLNRLWLRLAESEQQIVNYLAQQKKALSLKQLLQENPHNYNPEILLNTIQSLKRRNLLDTEQKGNHASFLKLNKTLAVYARAQTPKNFNSSPSSINLSE